MGEEQTYLSIPGYIPIKEAAKMLHVSEKRALQYVKTKRPPARKVSGRYLIPLPAVEAFHGKPRGRVRTHPIPWRIYRSDDLLLYDYSLRRLDEATDSEVYWFLADWFPRKALWASVSSMTMYLATFKKFFAWMGETGLVSPHVVAEVRSTLKEERRAFLRAVEE